VIRLRTRFAQAEAVLSHFGRDVRKRRHKLVGGMAFAVVYALAMLLWMRIDATRPVVGEDRPG